MVIDSRGARADICRLVSRPHPRTLRRDRTLPQHTGLLGNQTG